jgi:hypothetical protein
MGYVKHVTEADARQLTKTITPTHHDLFANRYKDVLDVVLACLALTQFIMTCCFFFVLAARLSSDLLFAVEIGKISIALVANAIRSTPPVLQHGIPYK